jgi:DNA-binding response OmpR family regulator
VTIGVSESETGYDNAPGDPILPSPPPAWAVSTPEVCELRHEVGNALTSASGYAQLLLRRLPVWADERDRRALLAIADSVARACRLFECGQPQAEVVAPAYDLGELLERAANRVPPERRADVRVRRPSHASLVGGWDPERLTQVLVNLLFNAAKYSPAGTPIEVEADRVGTSDWARVVVRDHGIGVEDDALEAIFAGQRTARAQQTAPGSGVGLRLSRRLVEAEGGQLWAMNVPDGGSAFYLELPLDKSLSGCCANNLPAADSAGVPPVAAVRDDWSRERTVALVIEDDQWIRLLLRELLERAGYAVVDASNGYTGFRLAAQLHPDIILLDLGLPECPGLELLDELKRTAVTCDIPIIVVSGSVGLLRGGFAAQADGVIEKPFASETLLAGVERALMSARGRPLKSAPRQAVAGWTAGGRRPTSTGNQTVSADPAVAPPSRGVAVGTDAPDVRDRCLSEAT